MTIEPTQDNLVIGVVGAGGMGRGIAASRPLPVAVPLS